MAAIQPGLGVAGLRRASGTPLVGPCAYRVVGAGVGVVEPTSWECTSHTTEEAHYVNLSKNLGMTLLAVWLIVTGLLQVVSIPIPAIGIIMAVLAIAAGVLILVRR